MNVENESSTKKSIREELCRLCANTDKQLIPIFQEEGIEHNIAEQIEKYLPIITVTKLDLLPLKICYQCTSTLIAWHNFFEQCRVADDRLKEILSVTVKIDENDDSYHDYSDDFHEDLEDDAPVADDPLVEAVLHELPVDDAQIPINPREEAILPEVSDSDTLIPAVSDGQIIDTCDNDPSNLSKKESKPAIENLNNSRCVAEETSACSNIEKQTSHPHRRISPSQPGISSSNFERLSTNTCLIKSTPETRTTSQSLPRDHRPFGDNEDEQQRVSDSSYEPKLPHFLANDLIDPSLDTVCEICGKSFSKKSNLRRHARTCAPKPTTTLVCNVCCREFSYPHSLRRHQAKCCADTGSGAEKRNSSAVSSDSRKIAGDTFSKVDGALSADEIRAAAVDDDDDDDARTKDSAKIERDRLKAHDNAAVSTRLVRAGFDTCAGEAVSKKSVVNSSAAGDMVVDDINSHLAAAGVELLCEDDGDHENADEDEAQPAEDSSKGKRRISEPFDKMAVIIDGRRCFKCDSCNYVGVVLSRMRQHYTRHTGDRPFTCDQCGRQFRLLNVLRNHVQCVHEGVRRFGCELCGRHFAEYRYMQIHRRLHAGERLFVCDVCGARFGYRASLQAHQRTHASTPSFVCAICAKSYVHRSSYLLHMKRHRGELNYRCDVCGKAFIDRKHLQRHETVHSEERPFACEVCGASFKLTKYLQSHMKTHRKETASAQQQPVVYVDCSKKGDWQDSAAENAESVEEKRDPLTKKPQTCSSLLAEDRAKLVKSKKLGPLLRKCKEVDVAILECGHCSAFFIDKVDFEKHVTTHALKNVSSDGNETGSGSLAGAKPCSPLQPVLTQPTAGGDIVCSLQKPKIKRRFIKKNKIRESPASIRSSNKSTRKRILSGNRSNAKSSLVPEGSGNIRKLKRKLDGTKLEKAGTTDGDADSSRAKKRKKSAKPDEGDVAKSSVKRTSSAISNGESSALSSGPVPVARSGEEKSSDVEGESRSEGRKCAPVKKSRPRRVQRDDDECDKGDETYTCAHCLRNFRRKSNLKRHMVKLHCAGKSADKSGGAPSSKWFTGYCCDVCGEGLQHRPTMMAHRDVVHGTQSEIDWVNYQTSLARVKFCPDCKKYFRSGHIFEEHGCDRGASINDASLAERVRSAEEARPKFACSVCNVCFRWKWDYRLHREGEHGDAAPVDWTTVVGADLPNVCEQCFKAYPSADELAAHSCAADLRQQQTVGDESAKQYRCALCDHEYFWKSDYRRHMRLKHPKENYRPTEHDTIVYSCPYCAELFTLKKGILLHMRKAHNVNSDSPFMCVKCNKVFRRRDNLDRHNESYHPAVNDADEVRRILIEAEIRINGDVTYHCAVCSRNIANSNRFISHYRGHYSESKFKCDLCGKQTRTQHQLNTHIKNIHLNIRNYRCDLCEKSFYTKQACEEHRRIHTGERPFSCEICGKTFIAGNALISHKRFHNDFYPHSCHLCPKKFKVRRSLINHVRTHTGERPYQCDLCAKTFNNSSQYSYHKKVTHSEDRPFSCAVCGNRFKANKFLTRHMEVHDPLRGGEAQPRKTKVRSDTGAAQSAEAYSTVAQSSAAIIGDAIEERGIQIYVSAPSVSAAPLADAPSIVNVVSTMPTTVVRGGNRGGAANVQIPDENILPGPEPLFDAQLGYDQFAAKAGAIRDSNAAAYVTSVEYVQVADPKYKPAVSNQAYSTVAQQPGPSHGATATKNLTWL